MTNGNKCREIKLESSFDRATGVRDWHATIKPTLAEHFQEMDLRVTVRGENTTRFNPMQ